MIFKRFMILFVCFSLCVPPGICADPSPASPAGNLSFEALQAAEILGVKPELERLQSLQKGGAPQAYDNEILSLKAVLLRKILLGFIQVRQASNKTDVELSYTYDILYREQNKEKAVLEAMNLLNFSQLAVLYTIAPYSRINHQFTQSSVIGCISAGIGTTLPIASILYGKFHKISNTEPPKFLKNSLDGAPVDASNLPTYVSKFLDYSDQGTAKSRKEQMFEFWKADYHVDPSNKETLGGINDNKHRSLGWLNTRIVLLYSLRNQIQKFDRELLALSNVCRTPLEPSASANLESAGLSNKAKEAARLLGIKQQVAELVSLNSNKIHNKRRLELEAAVLEQVLAGLLEVRIATDKVDQELNYSYDIALAALLAARAAALQKNFEANFIQSGTLVAVAKLLFLKGYPKEASEILCLSGALGTGLSSLAILLGRGGHRKMSDNPNSLAEFLELDSAKFHFSRLMNAFLDTPSDESSEGKSKKEELLAIWKRDKISAMKLDSKANRNKLAAMPPAKFDTIKIINNRIALLYSLKINLEFFDKDLLELMQETGFNAKWSSSDTDESASTASAAGLSPSAAEAARLLGFKKPVAGLLSAANRNDDTVLKEDLELSRKALQALLEIRVIADRLEFEIVKETETRDRMVNSRDRGISFTNNANFFQLGILSIIADGPLALSGQRRYRYYSDCLNVISGYLVSGLTAATFLQQKGGYRPTKAEPNMLSQILGLDTDPDLRFSPFVWKFLNSPNPASDSQQTRREQLLEYWKKLKVVSLDPNKPAAAEKLAANGNAHHWWCETIKLINSRLNMLYAVHAAVDLLEKELSDLLMAAE